MDNATAPLIKKAFTQEFYTPQPKKHSIRFDPATSSVADDQMETAVYAMRKTADKHFGAGELEKAKGIRVTYELIY